MNSNIESIANQVKIRTPQTIIHLIAAQMERIEEAKKRIDEEGIVVRDLKGAIVPHPAIKIEQDCIKLVADLLKKHSK